MSKKTPTVRVELHDIEPPYYWARRVTLHVEGAEVEFVAPNTNSYILAPGAKVTLDTKFVWNVAVVR